MILYIIATTFLLTAALLSILVLVSKEVNIITITTMVSYTGAFLVMVWLTIQEMRKDPDDY